MKILKIYLCKNEETNNNMIIDYYSFTKDINYNHMAHNLYKLIIHNHLNLND